MKYIHWIDPIDINSAPRLYNHGFPDGTVWDFGYGTHEDGKMVRVRCVCRVDHTVNRYNQRYHEWASRNMARIDEGFTLQDKLEFQKVVDPHYTIEIKGKKRHG